MTDEQDDYWANGEPIFEPVDDADRFDLVMPFVICQSNGGPHDDAAFVSGYRLGTIDTMLGQLKALGQTEPESVPIKVEERAQLDLIAMRHGFITTGHGLEPGGWETIGFQAYRERF